MKARLQLHLDASAKKNIRQLQIDEWNKQNDEIKEQLQKNLYVSVLWTLHTQYGWGQKRLTDFYVKLDEVLDDIMDSYHFQDDTSALYWYCEKKLKEECGIDFAELDEILEQDKKGENDDGL